MIVTYWTLDVEHWILDTGHSDQTFKQIILLCEFYKQILYVWFYPNQKDLMPNAFLKSSTFERFSTALFFRSFTIFGKNIFISML